MATKTLPPTGQMSARRTTIFMKMTMAVSGALFVFYVLMHMYGNLKILAGNEAFDEYAHHLRTMFEPILPYSGFLWLFRILLIIALVAHAYSAFYLWSRANNARTTRYVAAAAARTSLRTKWMRWGGVALLAFLIFHLIQFTIVKVNFNSSVSASEIGDSPAALVVASFQLWWVVLIYLVALVALGLHLFHGVWSGAQTLGWTTSPGARRTAKATATVIALVTAVGFAIPPLAILLGIVKGS